MVYDAIVIDDMKKNVTLKLRMGKADQALRI